MTDRITSVKNPLALAMRALKDKETREANGRMLVEGPKMVLEALACGLTPGTLLRVDPADTDVTRAFVERGGALTDVAEHVLDSVCDTRSPQGLCASFSMPAPLSLENPPDRLVALDGVQDPGNVGTIWRTADAAGFSGLLLGGGCADPFSPKTQRAAMGSGFRLPCGITPDLAETLAALRVAGWDIVVSHLKGDPFDRHPPVSPRFVLVVGSEARGVSEAVENVASMRLKLPMRGGAESLNAAVAAGIMMYALAPDVP